jgi:hypothetical protein
MNRQIAEMLIRLALSYKDNGLIEFDVTFCFGELNSIYFDDRKTDVKIAYEHISEKVLYQVKLDLEKCNISEVKEKEVEVGLANTKELRRIILCLKGKELDINSIRTNAELENKQATDGINFLVRYNLVEELNNNKYTSDKKRK